MKLLKTQGFWMAAFIVIGLGLAALGYAKSESYAVAQIQPLSKAIHVANVWIWYCAVPGIVLAVVGFAWLAIKTWFK